MFERTHFSFYYRPNEKKSDLDPASTPLDITKKNIVFDSSLSFLTPFLKQHLFKNVIVMKLNIMTYFDVKYDLNMLLVGLV